MTEEQKQKRLRANRRWHLKAAVRKYAKVFDMKFWFLQNGNRLIAQYDRLAEPSERSFPNSPPPLPPLKKFEECGTACCIAGLDYMRSGRTIKESAKFYGFPEFGKFACPPVFIAGDWPDELKAEYFHHSAMKNHTGMAEAACKAIDYFGK